MGRERELMAPDTPLSLFGGRYRGRYTWRHESVRHIKRLDEWCVEGNLVELMPPHDIQTGHCASGVGTSCDVQDAIFPLPETLA